MIPHEFSKMWFLNFPKFVYLRTQIDYFSSFDFSGLEHYFDEKGVFSTISNLSKCFFENKFLRIWRECYMV